MIDSQLKDKFLAEAIRIGDEIADTAIYDEHGCYWLVRDFKENIEIANLFYNGNSGIIYYLTQLYTATRDDRYYRAMVAGTEWLIYNKYRNNDGTLAFYCGSGSIIYTLLAVSRITGNQLYRHISLQMARELLQHESNSDILYGTAGSILTLLHLHNETSEDWLLALITEKIKKLIGEAIFPETGICWERNGTGIHPICGFAHGGSGIAFVFIELYRYFGNELFLKIAEMAFEYEDQYFTETGESPGSTNNWPDLRKDTYTEDGLQKLKNAYVAGRFQEFTSLSFMSAWCHGAPGIGMARLHASEVTGHAKHLRYAKLALAHTISMFDTHIPSFTICHGVNGNACLLIDAYVAWGDENMYRVAIAQGERCLESRLRMGYYVSGISKTNGAADANLFNGTAGIGHYFLRLAHPRQVTSVLLPALHDIKTRARTSEVLDEQYLAGVMYRKIFQNTSLHIPAVSLPDAGAPVLSRLAIKEVALKAAANNDSPIVAQAIKTDTAINSLFEHIQSDNYLYVKHMVDKQSFQEPFFDALAPAVLDEKEVVLNSVVRIMQMDYGNRSEYIVLIQSGTGEPVLQHIVGAYTYSLLSGFEQKSTIGQCFRTLEQKFGSTGSNPAFSRNNFLQQLKNCIKSGFLLFDHFPPAVACPGNYFSGSQF